MYLNPYCEIIGTLYDIKEDPLGIKAVFMMQRELLLPVDPKKLKTLLGKRIRIFNNNGTDIIKEVKK